MENGREQRAEGKGQGQGAKATTSLHAHTKTKLCQSVQYSPNLKGADLEKTARDSISASVVAGHKSQHSTGL